MAEHSSEREALKERLMEAIAGALGDALDCTRTWNAWSVGTMSDRDFVEVRGDTDRLGEIAEAALSVLSTAAPICATCDGHGMIADIIDKAIAARAPL